MCIKVAANEDLFLLTAGNGDHRKEGELALEEELQRNQTGIVKITLWP